MKHIAILKTLSKYFPILLINFCIALKGVSKWKSWQAGFLYGTGDQGLKTKFQGFCNPAILTNWDLKKIFRNHKRMKINQMYKSV